MPKLTHEVSGVVVSVSDDTATRLGSEWVAVEAEKPKRPAKKSDK